MKTTFILPATALVSVLAISSPGLAQNQPSQELQTQSAQQQSQVQNAQGQPTSARPPPTGTGQQQVADACIRDLRAFDQEMNRDGYWISGWGTTWGAGPAVGGARTMPPASASPTDQTSRSAAAPANAEAGAGVGAQPWIAGRWGAASPRYQIGVLYRAANVLARRNSQEGCSSVVAELRSLYGAYVAELRKAGVDPRDVTSWRQERLALARPVSQTGTGFINIADVTGTEVRNARDERLGTISDVVVDPQSGEIRYAILSSGGFFGIGDKLVAVPWSAFKATPGLNTFVLDVNEQVIDQAPKVAADRFANPAQIGERRQEVDQFWTKHISG